MAELVDIFRASATNYLQKYGHKILPSHKRAIRDIISCRTQALGGDVYLCHQCEQFRYSYHSCKNRHCPKCGNEAATVWLTAQSRLLLPVPHFLVTVTLPAHLRKLARQNQKRFYGLMMRCAAQALRKLAKDPKWIVDMRPVGKGKTALEYLAPSNLSRDFGIFRVAISNKRIVAWENGRVSFRYQDNKGFWHIKTLTAEAFMACFLQHVLPKRFVKVRYYGFFSPRRRDTLENIKEHFDAAPAEEHRPGEGSASEDQELMRCPKCGSPLLFVREILPQNHVLSWSNALPSP